MEKITCPNCSQKFDIEGALAKDLDARYQKQIADEKQQLLQQYKEKENALSAQQENRFKPAYLIMNITLIY